MCRCEEVCLEEIKRSILEDGVKTTRELKLRTRAGMGFCQSRTCRPLLEQLVSHYSTQLIPDSSDLTNRAPIRPPTLSELAQSRKDNSV
ncbi:(2Fe-2S)-binding protein [Virgibacillus kekensis]|uniref:(2Fe-2S)-binding protein n=1 Tax=Virgibacillus kekensis TaxID=202261 RepID=A0ABV9DPY4_9BACI